MTVYCRTTALAPADTMAGCLAKALTFIRKDARIALSYRFQFLFQFVQIFFSVAVAFYIGKMVAGSGESAMLQRYGGNYFAFALIGLAVNSYLRAGLVSVTNDMRQMMNQGIFEAVCATPIDYASLLLFSSLWQFAFETFRVTVYFGIAFTLFGLRLEHSNIIGAMLTLCVTAPIFLMLGMISCSVLVVVKRGDPINWIFSGVAALLAGTMFPVSVLPDWLQRVAWYIPLTHALEAVRRCLLTGASVGDVSTNIGILIAFVAVLIPTTVCITNACMNYAKNRGAFATH